MPEKLRREKCRLVFDDMGFENSPEVSPTSTIERAILAQALDSR